MAPRTGHLLTASNASVPASFTASERWPFEGPSSTARKIGDLLPVFPACFRILPSVANSRNCTARRTSMAPQRATYGLHGLCRKKSASAKWSACGKRSKVALRGAIAVNVVKHLCLLGHTSKAPTTFRDTPSRGCAWRCCGSLNVAINGNKNAHKGSKCWIIRLGMARTSTER